MIACSVLSDVGVSGSWFAGGTSLDDAPADLAVALIVHACQYDLSVLCLWRACKVGAVRAQACPRTRFPGDHASANAGGLA